MCFLKPKMEAERTPHALSCEKLCDFFGRCTRALPVASGMGFTVEGSPRRLGAAGDRCGAEDRCKGSLILAESGLPSSGARVA